MKPKSDSTKPAMGELPQWLAVVRERVTEVRFGTVQIVIHEGRVTQIESTQRTRLPFEPEQSRDL